MAAVGGRGLHVPSYELSRLVSVSELRRGGEPSVSYRYLHLWLVFVLIDDDRTKTKTIISCLLSIAFICSAILSRHNVKS